MSIATAAQAMLAQVLMEERKDEPVRLNELVLYSSFGWGNDDANQVSGSDIGRYVAHLPDSTLTGSIRYSDFGGAEPRIEELGITGQDP